VDIVNLQTCKPANLQTCKPQFDIAAPRVARARALPEAREGHDGCRTPSG
jgi:hypothetical protein